MDDIRPPDSSRNERLLGGGESPPLPSSRRRRQSARLQSLWDRGAPALQSPEHEGAGAATQLLPPRGGETGAVITWDSGEDEEEQQLRLAVEESLREAAERKREEEAERRREECREKYGLVRSRLRLMRRPPVDPLVDTWLRLIDERCEGSSLRSAPVEIQVSVEELRDWLERRVRSATTTSCWCVLEDLL